MNVTANNCYILVKERSCLKCLLYLTEVLRDIYIGNTFLKFSVIDGEYIVKISRGIIKHVYEVMMLGFVKIRHKVPLITI